MSGVGFVFHLSGVMFVVAELMTVAYNYMLLFLIDYLNDTEATMEYGLKIAGGFCGLIFASSILRNLYIASGYYMAVKIRKILSSAMYDKIATLSMRSMTETNSGKLVTLISADIASLERTLSFAPLIIYAPLVAAVTIYLIGITSDWGDALIIGVLWVFTIMCSVCTGFCQK